ncbi:uncharacterized protein B0H64DRAFT_11769 [Chaetomium fimeti]|uniref:Uncharacterized protein n=1 Tax=Chaetomium fimeti TaxID=1854472 RepID=A0AAE0HPD1_9PEZI|nr:hypothetical protein B0H64DRAFT_11769 [Chaetomium fimeti]
MNPMPCCSHKSPGMANPVPIRRRRLLEILEIIISSLCSMVTWEYTTQNEIAENPDEGPRSGDTTSALVFHPSPGLMLLSCLVFGCCVSSFAHRRQSQDPFQFVVYLVLLSCAAAIGYAARAHVYLILLGYLPWATCVAMVISISGPGVYRFLKPHPTTSQGGGEKARYLG